MKRNPMFKELVKNIPLSARVNIYEVKHIGTGEVFLAEYSSEAAEFYRCADGTPYELGEVEIL